jgi:predicted transcriptional regulator
MSQPRLPDAELDVMSCLWEGGPQTARQVRESLQPRRPLAHASVCTLLKRLEVKGLVRREKAPAGKAYIYSASTNPDPTHRRLLADFLDRVFAGSGVSLVASLLETRPPSSDEIDELDRLIRNLRERNAAASKERKGQP